MSKSHCVLDNVERISHRNVQVFLDHYLRSMKPVIVRGCQEQTSIANVTSEAGAVDAFGDIRIQVQENYTSQLSESGVDARKTGLSRKVRNDIREITLREYLEHLHDNPKTALLCVEYATPSAVLDSMRLPEICQRATSSERLVSFTFVANAGNYAHLHFDGDFRHVLLYQVFGRKRVVMVPVEALAKVLPAMNFSKLFIQNMSEREKLDLFRYLGAYDCIIEPGEAIYFPPSIWHYVEYLDTGMSVSFRFGRQAFARQLVDANRVPFYPELHLLLSRLSSLEDGGQKAELEDRVWREASATLARTYPSTMERHRAADDLYRRLAASVSSPDSKFTQLNGDCAIADAMAIERYDSPSKRWREELQLGAPL